jgi:putative transposase
VIQAAGARLWYLPPYSPDLNPIEQARQDQTLDANLPEARRRHRRQIGSLATTIAPGECSNYFINAGYASVKM